MGGMQHQSVCLAGQGTQGPGRVATGSNRAQAEQPHAASHGARTHLGVAAALAQAGEGGKGAPGRLAGGARFVAAVVPRLLLHRGTTPTLISSNRAAEMQNNPFQARITAVLSPPQLLHLPAHSTLPPRSRSGRRRQRRRPGGTQNPAPARRTPAGTARSTGAPRGTARPSARQRCRAAAAARGLHEAGGRQGGNRTKRQWTWPGEEQGKRCGQWLTGKTRNCHACMPPHPGSLPACQAGLPPRSPTSALERRSMTPRSRERSDSRPPTDCRSYEFCSRPRHTGA